MCLVLTKRDLMNLIATANTASSSITALGSIEMKPLLATRSVVSDCIGLTIGSGPENMLGLQHLLVLFYPCAVCVFPPSRRAVFHTCKVSQGTE